MIRGQVLTERLLCLLGGEAQRGAIVLITNIVKGLSVALLEPELHLAREVLYPCHGGVHQLQLILSVAVIVLLLELDSGLKGYKDLQ